MHAFGTSTRQLCLVLHTKEMFRKPKLPHPGRRFTMDRVVALVTNLKDSGAV